ISPDGQIVLEYIYDSYGNFSVSTPDNSVGSAFLAMFILALNPLSYRGYLYAPGIGVSYYLGSRFYSPQICRFMNADVYQDTGTGAVGTNMFAYCNNNPVMNIDPTGEASYKFSNIQTNWFVIFLNKLIGVSISTNSINLVSINYKNIKVALSVKCNTKWNTKSFFSVDKKGNLSCSLNNISFSSNNGRQAISTSFTYNKTTINAAVKLSNNDVILCISVKHNCYHKNNTKIELEMDLAFSISYTMITGIAVTVVAASVLKPVLIPVFTKGALAIKSLVSAPAGLKAAILPIVKAIV
ncbi:MAG: RHS repeat-associated core domain-containing protein, partial [Clostridia bacterium]|nr:RHS repeat-associated core domain-containing protein [Clostridia bacterium]